MTEERAAAGPHSPPVVQSTVALLFWSAVVLAVMSMVVVAGATEIQHSVYAAGLFVAGAVACTGGLIIQALSHH